MMPPSPLSTASTDDSDIDAQPADTPAATAPPAPRWRLPTPVLAGTAVIGVAALGIFVEIFRRDTATDLAAHADMTVTALRTGEWQGNFLFYGLNALFAGFTTDERTIRISAAAILTLSVMAKYLVTWRFADRELQREGVGRGSVTGLAAVLVLLMLCFSIPTKTIYIGQLPANVWHNSTTILLMPFAVLLFATSLAYVRTLDRKWLLWALGVGLLGILTKPTFAMALGFVLPVFALVERRQARAVAGAVVLSVGLAVLIGLQYLYIYHLGPGTAETDSNVVLKPFHVWEMYTDNVLRSVLASVAFPLVALAVLRRRLWSYDAFRFAVLLTIVGIGMFALLSETGPREFDGNFAWQAYVAVYVLFMVTLVRSISAWRAGLNRIAASAIAIAFLVHVASGIWFVTQMFHRGTPI
jgi:hypothetical protein